MATREVYHVVPEGTGWAVKREGNPAVLSRSANKDAAIMDGRRMAQAAQLGQLIIHLADGTIEKEYTYGQDPRRTPG